jgi:hypothetical protein
VSNYSPKTLEILDLMRQHDLSCSTIPRGSIAHATGAIAVACANDEITEVKARELQHHVWDMFSEKDTYDLTPSKG